VKGAVFVLALSVDISDLEYRIYEEAASVTRGMLAQAWEEMEYQIMSAV
jgi:hypothetical protein